MEHDLHMADRVLINEGVIAEQFIGQHLLDMLSKSPNRELNYWLREGRSSNAADGQRHCLGSGNAAHACHDRHQNSQCNNLFNGPLEISDHPGGEKSGDEIDAKPQLSLIHI